MISPSSPPLGSEKEQRATSALTLKTEGKEQEELEEVQREVGGGEREGREVRGG